MERCTKHKDRHRLLQLRPTAVVVKSSFSAGRPKEAVTIVVPIMPPLGHLFHCRLCSDLSKLRSSFAIKPLPLPTLISAVSAISSDKITTVECAKVLRIFFLLGASSDSPPFAIVRRRRHRQSHRPPPSCLCCFLLAEPVTVGPYLISV